MADFFDILAARATGQLEPVIPRHLSRFEMAKDLTITVLESEENREIDTQRLPATAPSPITPQGADASPQPLEENSTVDPSDIQALPQKPVAEADIGSPREVRHSFPDTDTLPETLGGATAIDGERSAETGSIPGRQTVTEVHRFEADDGMAGFPATPSQTKDTGTSDVSLVGPASLPSETPVSEGHSFANRLSENHSNNDNSLNRTGSGLGIFGQSRPEPKESDNRITVSIGRVEINAVQPSSPPQPPRREVQSPRLSLTEYLQRSRKGQS